MEFETFAPLTELPFVKHLFTLRGYAGIPPHAVSAEQTHGNEVAVVTTPGNVPRVDALATRQPGLPLLIRCADCAAVYIVDRRTPAIALIHSGKKGTELNITGNTVAAMRERFGTDPTACRALISPSIGPCHYEMDIWASIESQLQAAGIRDIQNLRICTACHLDRYYSYRAEKGHTGRMYALLALCRREICLKIEM